MLQQPRVRLIIGVVLLLVLGAGLWAWSTSGREVTDDAQVDAHVTQMAARVGGTVTKVAVDDNQLVEAGTLLVELDPRDYQVAVDKARAELADAEASAIAAQSNVPITSTTAASNVTTARGGVDPGAERRRGVGEGDRSGAGAPGQRAGAGCARPKPTPPSRRATSSGCAACSPRTRSRSRCSTRPSATAEAQKATVDSARSQVAEAEAGIRVAESKLAQAKAGEDQARAEMQTAQTGPSQVAADQGARLGGRGAGRSRCAPRSRRPSSTSSTRR